MGLGHGTAADMRIAELSDQIEALSVEVRELRAAQTFDRTLVESRSPVA
jgi:hypothetical protein